MTAKSLKMTAEMQNDIRETRRSNGMTALRALCLFWCLCRCVSSLGCLIKTFLADVFHKIQARKENSSASSKVRMFTLSQLLKMLQFFLNSHTVSGLLTVFGVCVKHAAGEPAAGQQV